MRFKEKKPADSMKFPEIDAKRERNWDTYEKNTQVRTLIAVTYPESDNYGLISDLIVIFQNVSDGKNSFSLLEL